MGIISPLGAGLAATLAALREGRDCVSEVTAFDTSKCRSKTAGQVTSLPEPASKKEARLHRASHMMIHAVREMLAGDPRYVPDTLVIGTTSGGMSFGEQFYRGQVSGTRIRGRAALVANYPPQKAPMDAMEAVGFRAPVQIIANACASGTNAIGHAFHLIRAGLKRRVLCGGYDAISEMVFVGFDSLQASTMEKVRPFDKGRSGLVLGEGAAVLALEDFESARERGAPILAEITGYGISTDNHHLTQPHPSGIGPELAMRRALNDAALTPAEVDYINAHGTATPFNDASEGAAIAKLFGARVPVSSTKAMMGHSLGAAGAIEAVFSVLAIREGFLPPNINFQESDPACDLNIAANTARASRVGCVVSNSFGFGGTNASVVIEAAVPESNSVPGRMISDFEKRARLTANVAGAGCVTPLGGSLEETARRILQGERVALTKVGNAENGRMHSAALVPPEFTAHLGREPRLRRASPISLLAAAAGNAAIADSGVTLTPALKSRLAVVFGVSSGGVQYTRRFYGQIMKQGANAASPLLFPETVYNAPASHLAAMIGVDGATYTLVGDGTVGLQALEFGAQLIATDDADHVLVVAAEEFDWILSEAHRAWRLVPSDGRAADEWSCWGVPLAEGAAAVLLSRDAGRAKVHFAEGRTHFLKNEAAKMMAEAIADIADRGVPDAVVSGANGTWIDAAIERAIARQFPNVEPERCGELRAEDRRPRLSRQTDVPSVGAGGTPACHDRREAWSSGIARIPGNVGPACPALLTPKRALGECLGAGALLQVVIALEELRRTGGQRALVAALGWNQQAAAAVIERTAQ